MGMEATAIGDARSRQPSPQQTGRLVLLVGLTVMVVAVLAVAAVMGGFWRMAVAELVLVVVLSLLPAWLYLEFVVHRGRARYDEYVLNLFRLHLDEYRNLPAPPQHTSYYALWRREHDRLATETTDNLYRDKFESVYGPLSVSTRALIDDGGSWRDLARTFAPVALATGVLCLGWLFTLQPELLEDVPAAVGLSGRAELPTALLRLGFLGAYSFVVLDLLRRYHRDDLRPAAYVSVVVRVVVLGLIIVAVDQAWTWGRPTSHAVAFLLGFFPESGIRLLVSSLARPLGRHVPRLGMQHSLHELEGLGLWYEARLLEEGIEDLQNLATANLVDVMLRTRIPLDRLVDWLDQAFLWLHLPGGEDTAQDLREALREFGVRTATDLLRVWEACRGDPAFRAVLGGALDREPDEAAAVVAAVLAAFGGDPNFWHVRQYRAHEWLYRDGRRRPRQTDETTETDRAHHPSRDHAPSEAARAHPEKLAASG